MKTSYKSDFLSADCYHTKFETLIVFGAITQILKKMQKIELVNRTEHTNCVLFLNVK